MNEEVHFPFVNGAVLVILQDIYKLSTSKHYHISPAWVVRAGVTLCARLIDSV